MNKTLFGCGFKKAIETRRGEKFDVTPVLPKATKLIREQSLSIEQRGAEDFPKFWQKFLRPPHYVKLFFDNPTEIK